MAADRQDRDTVRVLERFGSKKPLDLPWSGADCVHDSDDAEVIQECAEASTEEMRSSSSKNGLRLAVVKIVMFREPEANCSSSGGFKQAEDTDRG